MLGNDVVAAVAAAGARTVEVGVGGGMSTYKMSSSSNCASRSAGGGPLSSSSISVARLAAESRSEIQMPFETFRYPLAWL